ncbi:MAG TPA: hypothetical protein VGF29_00610 [Hyphomicrobiaceae bacterium]
MTDTVPEIFTRYAPALGDLVGAITTALGNDPNAGASQDERLRAWMVETRRYIDPGFWERAKEVHAARQGARLAEQEAEAERELRRRTAGMHSAAQAAADDMAAEHPRPAFPKPKIGPYNT